MSDLSEQQLAANYEELLQEAVALISIYGDDIRFSYLDSGGEEVELMMEELSDLADVPSSHERKSIVMSARIHVELPETGVQLAVSLPAEASRSAEANRVAVGKPVHHLPPLQLRLSFPPDYPSASPPSILSLNSMWLHSEKVDRLKEHLDQDWDSGSRMPILYTWVESIKQSWEMLVHDPHAPDLNTFVVGASVGRSEEGEEGFGVESCGCEGRSSGAGAASGGQQEAEHAMQDAQETAIMMMRYNDQVEYINFQAGFWRCTICFEEKSGSVFIKLPECGHYFCRDCFSTHCSMLVKEGTVDRLQCPEPSCALSVPPYVLQSVLTQDEFHRWESLLLQKTLDRMEDISYCPRCTATCISEPDHMSQCPQCLYVFCCQCDAAWHPGESCIAPADKLEQQIQRQKTLPMSPEKRLQHEQDLKNQQASLRELARTTKKCPVCQMGVEKSGGCNKMTCGYCCTVFCWKCLHAIGDVGYGHFGENRCTLLEQEDIDRWNVQMNGLQNRAARAGARLQDENERAMRFQFMIAQGRAQPKYCPVCGQVNLKEQGNNLLRCWSCNHNFCGLCREWLRTKPGSHFGSKPGQCKQHT